MRPVNILTLFVLLLPSFAAQALSSDREQALNIEADRVDIDEPRGISVYRGHVQFRQGTLQLTGDSVTINLKNGDLQKAVAEGGPASYRQRPEGKSTDVIARASRMEYDVSTQQLTMTGNAVVEQGGDIFRGPRITYDMRRNTVTSGSLGGPKSEGGRVRITIQPRNKTR